MNLSYFRSTAMNFVMFTFLLSGIAGCQNKQTHSNSNSVDTEKEITTAAASSDCLSGKETENVDSLIKGTQNSGCTLKK